jgi:type IV pilus assembly protein PilV
MKPRVLQQGGFLLEALVAILIFSFGVLGLVGLQASAVEFTNDAQYRSEAAYLANTLIAQMWADDRSQIAVKYGMPPGPGPGYTAMKQTIDNLNTGLPGAAALPAVPGSTSLEILFNETAPVTPTSVNVRVVIRWKSPSDVQVHNYEATATIGQNL